MRSTKFARTAVVLLAAFVVEAFAGAQHSDQPEGYLQVIPRGRIASIDQPVFVSAEHAAIDPETWVFGVVVSGQPRAYALNILNSHEIVNDQVDDNRFAAVW